MRHVSLMAGLSMLALSARWRLSAPKHARCFVGPAARGGMFRGALRQRQFPACAAESRSVGTVADPCSVLGLPQGTRDEAEIRGAFRKLAKIYHPDVGETGDLDRFQEVQVAAQTLLEANGALATSGASLDSIFTFRPARTVTSSHAPPSSAAKPLEQSAYAGSRGDRIDVQACAHRRAPNLRKTAKVKQITHAASPDTVARVCATTARVLGVPAEAVTPEAPLEMVGIALEQGCLGFQQQAEVMLALEAEFGVEIVRILVGTWMKLDMPPTVRTVKDFADFVESKVQS